MNAAIYVRSARSGAWMATPIGREDREVSRHLRRLRGWGVHAAMTIPEGQDKGGRHETASTR